MSESTLQTDQEQHLLTAMKRIHELEQEIVTLKDTLQENKALKQQIIQLKKLYEQEKQANATLQNSGSDQKVLSESQQRNKQLERVIHFLRERAETAQLELQQLKKEYHAVTKPQLSHMMDQQGKSDGLQRMEFLVKKWKEKRFQMHDKWVSD